MSTLDLARRFTACTQAGDIDGARACLHEDCQIWQNFDGIAKTPDQIMATLAMMKVKCESYAYEVHRLEEVGQGYVQRHTLHMTSQSGEKASAEVMLLVTVKDGKIFHAEEFLDPAALVRVLS